ncbi:MAG TPA: galactose-1-phosphate uridylyltransferase [Planctomycetaceae bacterium]|nr:galactose-1-phosphate uridylyltransferase [Planctomycetaceae bacterium]HIQ21839.1 galactose-1-phosphate uridylyltransferase [Planctomycetota bacterium]
MPDLRKDPIVGRWVIVARNRARRPHDFDTTPQRRAGRFCPFCEGHEETTPNEIMAYRSPSSESNGPGWRVRVVPNKFPALEIEGNLEKRGEGIYDMMQGVGAHEVIIETPEHLVSTSDLSPPQLQEVLWVYRDRLVDLKKDPRLVYGMIFKNVGAEAGASLEHTHSQLIVTPIVPINVWEEMTGSLEFYKYRGRCIYCDMIQQELATEKRIVLDTPRFVAFCPFASRFPFETWVLPKAHSSHYENIQKNGVEELASVLREAIARIEAALGRPAYNYIIHTAPFDVQELNHYHWHLEITPSVTRPAGFEWGTGFYINPVPPEEAARFLRDVELDPLESETVPARGTG